MIVDRDDLAEHVDGLIADMADWLDAGKQGLVSAGLCQRIRAVDQAAREVKLLLIGDADIEASLQQLEAAKRELQTAMQARCMRMKF